TAHGSHGTFDGVMLTTSAAAPRWIEESGLVTDEEGFLLVDAALRSCGDERIFGAGDCVSIMGETLPRSGVYAVRQGVILKDNLRAAILGGSARRYRPQKHSLSLITTGTKNVIASRGSFTAEGSWLWRV